MSKLDSDFKIILFFTVVYFFLAWLLMEPYNKAIKQLQDDAHKYNIEHHQCSCQSNVKDSLATIK